MEFYVYPYRLVFRAQGEVYFPPGKAENVFRGKLGLKLKELVCDPFGCPGANVCERRADCAYVRMFEPKSGVVLPAAGGSPVGQHAQTLSAWPEIAPPLRLPGS